MVNISWFSAESCFLSIRPPQWSSQANIWTLVGSVPWDIWKWCVLLRAAWLDMGGVGCCDWESGDMWCCDSAWHSQGVDRGQLWHPQPIDKSPMDQFSSQARLCLKEFDLNLPKLKGLFHQVAESATRKKVPIFLSRQLSSQIYPQLSPSSPWSLTWLPSIFPPWQIPTMVGFCPWWLRWESVRWQNPTISDDEEIFLVQLRPKWRPIQVQNWLWTICCCYWQCVVCD